MKGIYIFDENGELEETIVADSFILVVTNDLRIKSWKELPNTSVETVLTLNQLLDEYRALFSSLRLRCSISPKTAAYLLRNFRNLPEEAKKNLKLLNIPLLDYQLLTRAAHKVKHNNIKDA